MINIKIGDLDIIETGSIVSPDTGSVQFFLGENNAFTLETEMSISNENQEAKLEAYEISKVGLGLRFVNFKNTLGTGNVNPFRIGWLNGRSLFLNYREFNNNTNGAIINYTFLLGKKVDANGNEIK